MENKLKTKYNIASSEVKITKMAWKWNKNNLARAKTLLFRLIKMIAHYNGRKTNLSSRHFPIGNSKDHETPQKMKDLEDV